MLKRLVLLVAMDNSKDVLKVSQELARLHLSQAQVYERLNSFERLFLKMRIPLGHLALKGKTINCSPSIHFTILSCQAF
jgi:hypothetical protein